MKKDTALTLDDAEETRFANLKQYADLARGIFLSGDLIGGTAVIAAAVGPYEDDEDDAKLTVAQIRKSAEMSKEIFGGVVTPGSVGLIYGHVFDEDEDDAEEDGDEE